jgi:hypothetical protein
MAADEAGQGLLTLTGDFAAPTQQLLARADEFQDKMQEALAITKPTFNEQMRSGHANM